MCACGGEGKGGLTCEARRGHEPGQHHTGGALQAHGQEGHREWIIVRQGGHGTGRGGKGTSPGCRLGRRARKREGRGGKRQAGANAESVKGARDP